MIQLFKNAFIRTALLLLLYLYRFFLWRVSGNFLIFVENVCWFLAANEKKLATKHLLTHFFVKNNVNINKIIRKMNHHFALSTIECLELWRTPHSVLSNVHFSQKSKEILDETLNKNRGIIIATGHIGNWELMAAKISRHARINTMVKSSYDPKLDKVIDSFRKSYGINPISRDSKNIRQEIANIFDRGEILGILMDQDTKVKGCFVPFFNEMAFTPTGAASLALKYNVPIIVAYCHREGAEHVIYLNDSIKIDPTADKSEEIHRITAEATYILEQAIRKEPSQWVWFHKRWKTSPDDISQNEQALREPKR